MNRISYEVWFKVPDNCTDSGWDDMSQVINELVDRFGLEVVTSYNDELFRFFQLEHFSSNDSDLSDQIRKVTEEIGAELWGLGTTIRFNVNPDYPDI